MTTATKDKTTDIAPKGKEAGLRTIDEGAFSNLLDTKRFEHMWRIAALFSKSGLVPEHYRGQPENCFIACQMAVRLEVEPFMFMQNTYIVHGKPGMEAKLAIALINTSGMFEDSLDYEIEGDNPKDKNYRVRAFAVRKSTGKTMLGPWIDWALVNDEGWLSKAGSKWKTMPAQMFQYRAATFFGRLHCPERLMGMHTVDEVNDIQPDRKRFVASTVTSTTSKSAALAARLTGTAGDDEPTPFDEAESPTEDPQPQPEPKQEPQGLSTWDLAVEDLAARNDVTPAKANTRLEAFAIKMFKVKSIDDLTGEQYRAIANHIANGDISTK